MADRAGNNLFGERHHVARGWRNWRWLNLWRMRQVSDDGVTIDYFVRGDTVVVTRIMAAFDAE